MRNISLIIHEILKCLFIAYTALFEGISEPRAYTNSLQHSQILYIRK